MSDDDEKIVHMSMRKEDYDTPQDYDREEECEDCGEPVLVSGDNLDIDTMEENVDPDEVDVFVCQVCGMKRVRARGMAG